MQPAGIRAAIFSPLELYVRYDAVVMPFCEFCREIFGRGRVRFVVRGGGGMVRRGRLVVVVVGREMLRSRKSENGILSCS